MSYSETVETMLWVFLLFTAITLTCAAILMVLFIIKVVILELIPGIVKLMAWIKKRRSTNSPASPSSSETNKLILPK